MLELRTWRLVYKSKNFCNMSLKCSVIFYLDATQQVLYSRVRATLLNEQWRNYQIPRKVSLNSLNSTLHYRYLSKQQLNCTTSNSFLPPQEKSATVNCYICRGQFQTLRLVLQFIFPQNNRKLSNCQYQLLSIAETIKMFSGLCSKPGQHFIYRRQGLLSIYRNIHQY